MSANFFFRGEKIDLDKVLDGLEEFEDRKNAEGQPPILRLAFEETLEGSLFRSLILERTLNDVSKNLVLGNSLVELSEEFQGVNDVESAIENVFCNAKPEAAETMLPLFFNMDLTEPNSLFVVDNDIRDRAYAKYLSLCDQHGLDQKTIRDDYFETFDPEWLYFPLSSDFESLTRNRVKSRKENEARKEAYAQRKTETRRKYEELFVGLFMGALCGPVAFIYIALNDDMDKPLAGAGVSISSLCWLLYLT